MYSFRLLKILSACAFLIFLSSLIFSQNNIGQYYDEAPLRTWNVWAPYPSRNAALGDCILALGNQDPLSGMHNPATLKFNDLIALSCSISANSIKLYRYSVVNTGEVIPGVHNTTIGPVRYFAIEHFGIGFSVKGINIAVNIAEQENYRRPELDHAYSISTGGRINALYSGRLRTMNFSFSYPIIKDRLQVGAAFSYLYGNHSKDFTLRMPVDENYIEDILKDEQKLRGSCFHLGLLYKVFQKFHIGFALRTPYDKRADSSVYRECSSSYVIIADSYFSEDYYHQPMVMGLGFSFQPNFDLLLTADLSFFRWKSYQAERFDLPLMRDFQNTLKIGIGIEYILIQKIGGSPFNLPIRIGYVHDPQPAVSPEWNHHYFTVGTGFNLSKLTFDFCAYLGKGGGKDINLYNRRVVATIAINL
jgi:hypothetical protein